MIIKPSFYDRIRAHNKTSYLAVKLTNGGITLEVRTDFVVSTPVTEDMVRTHLQMVPATPLTAPTNMDRTISVLQAANDIARVTRRAPGNVIVGSTKALAGLVKTAISIMECYEDDSFPDNELFVLYHGNMPAVTMLDGPFYHDDRDLNANPNWPDFIRHLEFV